MTIDSEGIHEIVNSRNPARKADIVFVHGLSGGSHSTWRNAHSNFFWPEELGRELPECGIWSLGHASGLSHWFSDEGMALEDRANNLALKLTNNGFGERPIIFITHSMGGLIVKELVTAAVALGGDNWTHVAKAVRGVVFLGTPHHGSHMATVAKGFAVLLRTQEYLKQMRFADKSLDQLHKRFIKWRDGSKCHVEAYVETKGVARSGWFGLKRLLPRVLVVPEISGDPNLSGCDCYRIPEDHITLVKPHGRNHDVYGGVLSFIEKVLGTTQRVSVVSVLENISNINEEVNFFEVESDDGISKFLTVCADAFNKGDLRHYHSLLKRHSLALKKCGRHRELSKICELCIHSKKPEQLYPIITYSQSKLVTYDLKEAFEPLHRILKCFPRLNHWSHRERLDFIRTYCEVLTAGGAFDTAVSILESFLATDAIEKIRFKSVSQAFGILGRAYLGLGRIDLAVDIFESTLAEQKLTADNYGIAIAEANLGTAYLQQGKTEIAIEIFRRSLEIFVGMDVRAVAWVELNLAIAFDKTYSTDGIDQLTLSAIDYYISRQECSTDYLTNLQHLKHSNKLTTPTQELISKEIRRVETTITENKLLLQHTASSQQIVSILNLKLQKPKKTVASRGVTKGAFKARSILIKSFKKSLDTDRAVQYVEKISSEGKFSIPFYNDFLVEVCKRRPDLIEQHLLRHIDQILIQSDSIRLFYANFLESEGLLEGCKRILDNVSNTATYEYLKSLGNYYGHRVRQLDMALEVYEKAIEATKVEHFKATVFNNMALAIHRHRKRENYDLAISYCKQSMQLRASVAFWYPSILMLALQIELGNVGDIKNLIKTHQIQYGLNKEKKDALLQRVHDRAKATVINKLFTEATIANEVEPTANGKAEGVSP